MRNTWAAMFADQALVYDAPTASDGRVLASRPAARVALWCEVNEPVGL
jgi:hypothetical protein